MQNLRILTRRRQRTGTSTKFVFQNVPSGTFLIYLVSPVDPDRRALISQYRRTQYQPLNSHREPKYSKKHEKPLKINQNQGVRGQIFADFLRFPSNSLTSTCPMAAFMVFYVGSHDQVVGSKPNWTTWLKGKSTFWGFAASSDLFLSQDDLGR